ncbi:MAG: hypothetical protein U0531_12250 [Dehalococcoidia bacterium]
MTNFGRRRWRQDLAIFAGAGGGAWSGDYTLRSPLGERSAFAFEAVYIRRIPSSGRLEILDVILADAAYGDLATGAALAAADETWQILIATINLEIQIATPRQQRSLAHCSWGGRDLVRLRSRDLFPIRGGSIRGGHPEAGVRLPPTLSPGATPASSRW